MAEIECPDCGSDAEDLGDGTWRCRECGAEFYVGE